MDCNFSLTQNKGLKTKGTNGPISSRTVAHWFSLILNYLYPLCLPYPNTNVKIDFTRNNSEDNFLLSQVNIEK